MSVEGGNKWQRCGRLHLLPALSVQLIFHLSPAASSHGWQVIILPAHDNLANNNNNTNTNTNSNNNNNNHNHNHNANANANDHNSSSSRSSSSNSNSNSNNSSKNKNKNLGLFAKLAIGQSQICELKWFWNFNPPLERCLAIFLWTSLCNSSGPSLLPHESAIVDCILARPISSPWSTWLYMAKKGAPVDWQKVSADVCLWHILYVYTNNIIAHCLTIFLGGSIWAPLSFGNKLTAWSTRGSFKLLKKSSSETAYDTKLSVAYSGQKTYVGFKMSDLIISKTELDHVFVSASWLLKV